MNIFTIGHSNHKIEVFVRMLKDAGANTLVDVRSKPMSRFSPQFNQKALQQSLIDARIGYLYRGDALGGFGTPSPKMAEVMDGFLRWREMWPDKVPALMCAEKSPFECHRYYWLANWIKRSSDGFTVINIMPPREVQPGAGPEYGVDNWEADLSNLPPMAKEDAQDMPVYPWRVLGRLRGFLTQNDATAYCIAKEIDVGCISRQRTRA